MKQSTSLKLLSILLSICLLSLIACSTPETVSPPTQVPTSTPEPIIPTATPTSSAPESVPTIPTRTPVPTATSEPRTVAVVTDPTTSEHFQRFGISGWGTGPSDAFNAGMLFSQFLNWEARPDDLLPESVTHWKMLRASNDPNKAINWEEVEQLANATPGSVWIIGNEMDVKWQDNVSAETYATIYHDAYTRLKTIDPTSQIAFGGISQSTPLRLAYLDQVLASYEAVYGEKLPADYFTVHAYVLREERDSWGVDIPPGMDDINTGELYEIDDHASLDLFIKQLADYRTWMAANGYRDKPLAVTEFGILLPHDYGFPPDVVSQYMRDTINLMLTKTDETTGYPADENRLVQTWFWYVVEDTPDRYPSSNLYNSERGQLTQIGETWRDIVMTLDP